MTDFSDVYNSTDGGQSALSQVVPVRIGIDLGGTKIAGVAFGPEDRVLGERRIATPRERYDDTIQAIVDVVGALEHSAGSNGRATVGVGIPGSLARRSGTVQNANSTWLNGRPLDRDLMAALDRPVRLANDANCFALSEATDGAASGVETVFGVILGTGCGGGIVRHGRLMDGPRGVGGEWGHNPLPWAQADEVPGPLCWCGRLGCMETWVSGPALAADYARASGRNATGEGIVAAAKAGDSDAQTAIDRHASRLARGLAHVVNIIDPDVIVLGGGLSGLAHLYELLPVLTMRYVFAEPHEIVIKPPRWGDASGVRGAARLWPG